MNINPISFGSVYKVSSDFPTSSALRIVQLASGHKPACAEEKVVKEQLDELFKDSDNDTIKVFRNRNKDIFLLSGQDKADLDALILEKQKRIKGAKTAYMGDKFMINVVKDAEEDRFEDLSKLVTYSNQDGMLDVKYDSNTGTVKSMNLIV